MPYTGSKQRHVKISEIPTSKNTDQPSGIRTDGVLCGLLSDPLRRSLPRSRGRGPELLPDQTCECGGDGIPRLRKQGGDLC